MVTPSDQIRKGPAGPQRRLAKWAVLGVVLIAAVLLIVDRCPPGQTTAREYPSRSLPPEPEPVLLPPPPMDDDYLPCSDCHEDELTDRTKRELEEEHDTMEFKHGDLWCLDCHDADHRDSLHLPDNTLIDFKESWRLCIRCHPKKPADWRAGVHGKRMGYWWGPKEYWNCVACHGPHSPRFKPLKPKPPPKRAGEITVESLSGG